MIGFAMTGSFCTLEKAIKTLSVLIEKGYDVLPIMSEYAYKTDTRFGKNIEIRNKTEKLCGREIIHTIVDAEPLGPKIKLEALIVCPCTGNTLAKIANGITDTPVCMACKAHLRNNSPLILSVASNDALSSNLKNIATLLSKKNVYFTPMLQDDPEQKPHSLVADFELALPTIEAAMKGKQYQKIFI